MDLCSRPINGRPAPPTQYILGDTICNVTRSAYGRQLPQSSTRQSSGSKWFGKKTSTFTATGLVISDLLLLPPLVDAAVKSDIQKRIAEAEHEEREEGARIEELNKKSGALRQRYDQLKREIVSHALLLRASCCFPCFQFSFRC